MEESKLPKAPDDFKGERTVNLYKLIGSIIISDASTATEKEDTTKLWHMCLRHMSERGLQILHKRSALLGIVNLIFVNFALCVGNVE